MPPSRHQRLFLERARQAGGDSTEVAAARGIAHAVAGRDEEAHALLRQMGDARTYASPVRFAQVHAALGETEAALDRLDEAVGARATDLIWMDVFPAFAPLRDHPRFAPIHERVFGAPH